MFVRLQTTSSKQENTRWQPFEEGKDGSLGEKERVGHAGRNSGLSGNELKAVMVYINIIYICLYE